MRPALLGVGDLKRVNEQHPAGDEVLRVLGRRLRKEFRNEEIAACRGGNKFLVGMYGPDRQGSIRRLEDVCRALAQQPFAGEEFRVALSGGVPG